MTLTARLTVWYVGLLALLLYGLWIGLYAGATQLSTAAALGEVGIEASHLRQAVGSALTTPATLAPVAQQVITSRPMQENLVAVTDINGQVVAEGSGSIEGLPSVRAADENALASGTHEWLGVADGAESGLLAVSSLGLFDPGSGAMLGTVTVAMPIARAESMTRTFLIVVGVGFGLVLVIAATVGPRLTRFGLRPLRQVAAVSRELANGDLSARMACSTARDEVGDLGRAFNEMAAQLEANFAAQRAFVADASHELRTPLTAIGGLTDVLVHVQDTRPDEARRLAGLVRREVDRMATLVDELLVLARVDAQGAGALQLETVDVRSVARDVYEQARVLPLARGCDLQLRVGATAADVCGDPRRLHQVLLNLVTNALQHAPTGGNVWLTVDRDSGKVIVQVADDGPGIPAEHLAHVFDRFYRADTARDREDGGAGLGLAIARAIVEAHGGSIRVANAPRGGAVFSVALPSAVSAAGRSDDVVGNSSRMPARGRIGLAASRAGDWRELV